MLLKIHNATSIFAFLKLIKIDVLRIVVFSMIIGLVAQRSYFDNLMIPLVLVGIVGTAISTLIAFRTAQAYDRWWEARIVWGAIVNDSRSLIRELQLFLPESSKSEIQIFAHRQAIWCYALSESLRKVPFTERVQDFIDQEGITDMNKPNAILALHSKHLKALSEKGLISEFREVQIDSTLMRFCDAMGRCERIKNTVFPANYGKLIHFFIYFFALILPFALDNNYIIIKTTLTALIPLIFIMIERTAIIMQDPFENKPMDTPMTLISRTIENNLLEMIGQPKINYKDNNLDHYYVL